MTPAQLSCPACQCALRVPAAKPGSRVKCPRCGEIFTTPAAETLPVAPPSADPAPVAAPAPVPVADDDVFAKIAAADDPIAAAAEVRKPRPAPGEPGNPLPLDDAPPPKANPVAPRKAPTGTKGARPTKPPKKRRDDEWDGDEGRAAGAFNPLWLVGGLGVLAVGLLALGAIFFFLRQSNRAAETAIMAEHEADLREREAAQRPQPQPMRAVRPDPLEVQLPVVPPAVAPVGPPAALPERPEAPVFPALEPPPVRPPARPPVAAPVDPPADPVEKPKPAAVARPAGDIVRPAAHPAKITPTKADDKTEIKLPGAADLTCFGGGGRYVVLRIPSAKQIAVLDVCEGKVTKFLPLPEEGALIAAGNEHLFVLAPTDNIIQKWSLTTFERERNVANPLEGAPRHLLIGHATDGPLFVVGPNRALDTKTFKEVPLGEGANGARGLCGAAGANRERAHVNVSADGRVYAWHTQGVSPSGLSATVLGPDETKSHYEHTTVGAVLPGADGTLFTAGGVFTPDLKPVAEKRAYQYWYHAPIPAAHGKLYLTIAPEDDTTLNGRKAPPKVLLKALGDNKPLLDLTGLAGLDIPATHNQTIAKGLQLHNRVFLVPDAKAVAVLHGTADKVTIHKLDLK